MPSNEDSRTKMTTDQQQETGPWDAALGQLRDWDPKWAETCMNMSTNPWTSGVLPHKTVEFMAAEIMIYASGVMPPKLIDLLSIAFNTSYTHMYAPGTRRHIKAALRHGATIAEIIEVLKLCVVQGVPVSNCSALAYYPSQRLVTHNMHQSCVRTDLS
jgi:alkylhydroperoxidase/carboxymuconolactone decarboxylase family protein YurZ